MKVGKMEWRGAQSGGWPIITQYSCTVLHQYIHPENTEAVRSTAVQLITSLQYRSEQQHSCTITHIPRTQEWIGVALYSLLNS